MESRKNENALLVKRLAEKHGFTACGISAAGFLEQEARRTEAWLKKGYQGSMGYLENHFDMRMDPRLLVPGAKTVISLLYNYYPAAEQVPDTYHIARYAYGKDYHFVVKDRLREMLDELRLHTGDIDARVFVDSAPVLERAWAERAGLGWIGKHGLLISKNSGSWFFLAEIICDLECEPDSPVSDHCGTCTRCVDACPTDAILPDRTLNASKCISYLTIELRDEIPEEFSGKMQDWIFGCDICQEVCPWNRFARPHSEPAFGPSAELLKYGKKDWEQLGPEVFRDIFAGSAVKRTGYKGLTRNIRFVSGADTGQSGNNFGSADPEEVN